jgi:hypothetical protein
MNIFKYPNQTKTPPEKSGGVAGLADDRANLSLGHSQRSIEGTSDQLD